MITIENNKIVIRKSNFNPLEMELYPCLGVKITDYIILDPRHISKNAIMNMLLVSYPSYFEEKNKCEREELFNKLKEAYDFYINDFERMAKERLWYYDMFYQHQKDVLFFTTYRKTSQSALEQGLGKTITAISDTIMHNYDVTVVITTSISKWNWFSDLTDQDKQPDEPHWKFNPDWFTIYDSKKTIRGKEEKILLINYDMLKKYAEEIISKKPKHIIIDECHRIKNRDSKRSKRVIDMCQRTGAKVSLLSGTPSPNRTIDYFNYLKIGNHPYGKNYNWFLNQFSTYFEGDYGIKITGAKNTEKLNRAISNFMIRKLKAKCLDLPEKKYTRINFELNEYKDEYEKLYNEFIGNAGNKSTDENNLAIHTLNKLIAKCKVKPIIELIENILEEPDVEIVNGKEVFKKKKVAIFTTYTEPIEMLKEHFKERCVVIDGRVDSSKRMGLVSGFKNNNSVDLLIGQTTAAGESINLTFCTECIVLNFTMTRPEIDQITDRFHRIGLKKQLNVYFPVCRGTIDEGLYRLITRKYEDVSALIDGKSSTFELDNTNIRLLIDSFMKEKQVA